MKDEHVSSCTFFPRLTPCVIVADCIENSGDSSGNEIELALREFNNALQHDVNYRDKLDVCVMCSGKVILSFRRGEDFQIPFVPSGHSCSLDDALESAIELIELRKKEYRQNGINYSRPLLYVLSDGQTADCTSVSATKVRLQRYIEAKKLHYFPIGIGNANIGALQSYYPADAYAKPVLSASARNFCETFFTWDDDAFIASLDDNQEELIGGDIMHLDFSQRFPCVLLIDCFDPNDESKNTAIREALDAFKSILVKGAHLTNALDICIMSCGEAVNVEQDFITGEAFQIPNISTSKKRNLNTALNMALSKIAKQRTEYNKRGVRYANPLLIVVSDGRVTDQIYEEETQDRIRECIANQEVVYVPMGLGDTERNCLESYYPTYFEGKYILSVTASNFRDTMPSFWCNKDVPTPPIPNCITLSL